MSMKQEKQPVCSSCGEMVDQETISEYHEVKEAVEKVINMEQIPADAAPQGRFQKKMLEHFFKNCLKLWYSFFFFNGPL